MGSQLVLLDSCVMFPMYLRDILLRCAQAGFYIPFWSQDILDGATRNLVSTGRMSPERAMKLEMIIKAAFPDAMVEVPFGLAEVMTNHPGDRHVLAAAVTAKASIIVTSNLKHFKTEDLVTWNIEAQHPDTFLTHLYNLYPEPMIQVIQRQSQDLKKPPMTVAELLDLLSKQVPEFTSKVLFHEYSQSVVMIAKKALKSDFASIKSDGSRCIEGSRYQLWEKAGIITIVAKDNRGEILRVYNGHTEWNLLPKDVKAFQLFEQHLEQEITQLRNRKFKPDRLKFTEEC